MLKKIIACTDFSEAANNAMAYAAMLSEKTKLSLTLFNLYDAPVVYENQELERVEREKSEESMREALGVLTDQFPAVQIDYELSHGAFFDELSALVRKKGKSILVFGIEPKSWFQRNVYGTHSDELAGKVNVPVIIVPKAYTKHQLKKVVIGVEGASNLYYDSIDLLLELFGEVGAEVEILHINLKDKKRIDEGSVINIQDKPFRLKVVDAEDVESGLKKYSEANNIDLITILSRDHGVFENMFSESVTRDIAYSSSIPVLAIHLG